MGNMRGTAVAGSLWLLMMGCAADDAGRSALLPSRQQSCARQQRELARELEVHVQAMRAVTTAHVLVSLPACDPVRLAIEGAAPVSASVVARLDGTFSAGARDQLVREVSSLVAGAVAGLERERVSVVLTEAPSQRLELSTMGPFVVAQSSRQGLRWTVGALLGLIVALAAWAFLGERENAALRRRLAAGEPHWTDTDQ